MAKSTQFCIFKEIQISILNMYLTIYRDNWQYIYVYSCVKSLRGITTSMNTTIDIN